jgi:hypothetical protein
MKLINEILQWPAIIQGALGSGLFMLTLFAFQKILSVFTKYFKKSNISIQLKLKRILFFKLYAENIKDIHEANVCASILTYKGLEYLAKGIFYVVLGQLFYSFLPIFGYCGYIIGLFYISISVYCLHEKDIKNAKGKLDKLSNDIDNLENNKT